MATKYWLEKFNTVYVVMSKLKKFSKKLAVGF